ncbi:MAG: hypothetical protein AAF628_08300 [Planctomycetota bacterium]
MRDAMGREVAVGDLVLFSSVGTDALEPARVEAAQPRTAILVTPIAPIVSAAGRRQFWLVDRSQFVVVTDDEEVADA